MIIVTRPSPYGEHLTQLCQDEAIPAKHLPLFKIEPGHDLENLSLHLTQLTTNDIVIIVSPQVIRLLKEFQPTLQFPHNLRYFAVGQQTAQLFSQFSGIHAHYPFDEETSEGLIRLLAPYTTAINNTQVAILCGNVGRNVIPETLSSLGAKVKRVYCYKRIAIEYPTTILSSDIENQIIVVTSVEHLKQLDNIVTIKHKQYSQLIVSFDRVYQHAKTLGWQHIIMSDGANNQNLFKTITRLCHNACHNA